MSRYANLDYEYCGYDLSLEQNQDLLERGEIDLLTSVKWTEEMAARFDFSHRSIGTKSTVLTVKAGNTRIISGDEFIVFMRYVSSREDVCAKAMQLRERLVRMMGPEKTVQVIASIGISFYPQDGNTLDELYDSADHAMYKSKQRGKNAISLVDD